MLAVDHYAALGVAHDATDAELRRAWHEAARTHHPDRNPEGAAAFKRAAAAWEALGSSVSRQAYDASLRGDTAMCGAFRPHPPRRRPRHQAPAEDSTDAIRAARAAAASGEPVSGYCLSAEERAAIDQLMRRDTEAEQRRQSRCRGQAPQCTAVGTGFPAPRPCPRVFTQPETSPSPLLAQIESELASREEERRGRQERRQREKAEREARERQHQEEMERMQRERDRVQAERQEVTASPRLGQPSPWASTAENSTEGTRAEPDFAASLLVPSDESISSGFMTSSQLRSLRCHIASKLRAIDAAIHQQQQREVLQRDWLAAAE